MKKLPLLIVCLFLVISASGQKWQFGTDLFSQRKVYFVLNGSTSFLDKHQLVCGDLTVNYLLKKNWALRVKIDPLERSKDELTFRTRGFYSETKQGYRSSRTSFGVEKGWKIGRFKPFFYFDLEFLKEKMSRRTTIVTPIDNLTDVFEQKSRKLNENIGLGLEFYLSKRFSLRAESAFQNTFGWAHLSDGSGEKDFTERSFKFWWLNSCGAFVRF